jgi:hypothetical protein
MDSMPRVQKRKYEKTDEAEIALVIQCKDSHEFYERYRETFPTRKKGIDSISKIWKRRGEFIKKQQGESTDVGVGGTTGHELNVLITAQTRILTEISGLMKEQIVVSREILARLPQHSPKTGDHNQHTPHTPSVQRPPELKTPETKEPVKESPKRSHPGKPPADIMIGS